MLGKWHDLIFNVKWTRKHDGYLKQWIDGKLVYHYLGNTSKPGEAKNNFQFGIYRGPTPKTPKVSTQVAYYDEIRLAKKSCEKLKLEDLGYSCADLEKQKIHIETIGVVDTETIGVVDNETTDVVEKINIISSESSTPVMDGSYKLLWCRLDKHHKINLESRRFGVIDEVLIKDGKLSFIE